MTEIVLFDTETFYTEMLMHAFSVRRDLPFTVRAFTDRAAMASYVRSFPPPLLLVAEKDFDEEAAGIAGRTALLTDGNAPAAVPDLPRIPKYQSVSGLAASVVRLLPDLPGISAPESGDRAKLLVVSSPVGRCGKTVFSLALGQILSGKAPALYLTLEPWSALFPDGEIPERTLSDALYELSSPTEGKRFRPGALSVRRGDLSLIAPTESAEDIYETPGPVWKKLLRAITEDGSCRYVILETGPAVPASLFYDECSLLYVPFLPDPDSRRKLSRFLAAAERHPGVSGKLRPLLLPQAEAPRDGLSGLQLLTAGKTGSFVREQIRKDGL